MKTAARVCLGLLLAACLLLPSCVELDGQRISFFYDPVADEARILLFYDGVHDAKDKGEKGEVQVPQFVKEGDLMLGDWIGHVKMGELRKEAASTQPADAPAARELTKLVLTNLKTAPIGRYRDSSGKVGVAQRVVISNAQAFVTQCNAAISEAVLDSDSDGDDEKNKALLRTFERWRAAAKSNHRWLRLEGHSLAFTFPVHPREWAAYKHDLLSGLANGLVRAGRGKDAKNDATLLAQTRQWVLLLSASSVSYTEIGDEVKIRLGDPSTPQTLRLAIRDEYEPSLEPVLAKEIPAEVRPELVRQLLDDKLAGAMADVVAFGPPEETARPLVATAFGNGPDARRAFEKLSAWAAAWNQKEGLPAAPDGQKTASTAENWRAWLAAMERFPAATQPAASAPASTTLP